MNVEDATSKMPLKKIVGDSLEGSKIADKIEAYLQMDPDSLRILSGGILPREFTMPTVSLPERPKGQRRFWR